MFKRRNPKTFWRSLSDAVYPSIGWKRWLELLRKRIKRIPDTPHRIALGMAVGVAVTFTPLYGFHFLTAAIVALLLRANIIAAIIATFVGNPLTFPIIAVFCYRLGALILGYDLEGPVWPSITAGFREAWQALTANFWSLFGYPYVGWEGFGVFMRDVFLPYTVGGILPGGLAGLGVYFGARPLIQAYQQRRKGRMAEKLQEWRTRIIEASAARDEEDNDDGQNGQND
ncbi:MAG: DUF2062 domain-containing protein [Pseudomonadota bacterium]